MIGHELEMRILNVLRNYKLQLFESEEMIYISNIDIDYKENQMKVKIVQMNESFEKSNFRC